MLDKLFKSKKTSLPAKEEAKLSAKKDKSSTKSKTSAKSDVPKPCGIPSRGSIASRSRTPSRENLAKCRINPPGGTTAAVSIKTTANRLSSDSGIHSPAELKEPRESGLVRNNSLPSSRVHSTKESGISQIGGLSRQTALRASTNSSLPSKKEQQRSLPKALSYKSDGGSRPGSAGAASKPEKQLTIPPPLPSSVPPPSQLQVRFSFLHPNFRFHFSILT